MNLFYYIFYLIIYCAKMIGLYDGQKLFYLLVGIGLLFYALKLATTRMSVLEYGVTALLMGVAAVVYLSSGEKGLLLCMAVITGMKGVDRGKMIRLTAFSGWAIFLLMVLLTSLGIVHDRHHITEKFGGLILRRDFGQPGSNVTHTVLFVLISLFLFLYGRGKHLIKLSAFLMILNGLCFAYTLSVTGFLSIIVLLVINLIFSQVRSTDTKGFVYMGNAALFLVALFSIVLPLLLKGQVFEICNKLLNHRLEYGRYFLENESISLFGSRFAPAPNSNYYLDNSFLYLFLQLGVITFFIMLMLLFMTLNWMLHTNDIGALTLFTAYIFIGLSDPFLFNTSFKNITLIFVGMYLYTYLETLNERYRLKCRRLLNPGELKISRLGSSIYSKIEAMLTDICGFFDNNANMILVLFVLLPLVGVTIYAVFPQLFDVSLLAAGDRLVYDYEAEVQLNHDINKTFCALRTGILDGMFISIAIVIGKAIHDRRIVHDNNSLL